MCNTTPAHIHAYYIHIDVYVDTHTLKHAYTQFFVCVTILGVARSATHSKIYFIYILIEIWNENKQKKNEYPKLYNFNSGGLSFLLLILILRSLFLLFHSIWFLVSKFFLFVFWILDVIRLCVVCMCVVVVVVVHLCVLWRIIHTASIKIYIIWNRF